MNTQIDRVELPVETPFTIARGTTQTTENVVVSIAHDGETGYGAAAPSSRYGESIQAVVDVLPGVLEVVETVGDPVARRTIADRLQREASAVGAARAAVDIAVWDLAGKHLDLPVYRVLGSQRAATGCPATSMTVGLDDPTVMEDRARDAVEAGAEILKVKLGSTVREDRERIAAIRAAAPDATLRVDANEGWSPAAAIEVCEALAASGVEFVEQPVAADNPEGLQAVYEEASIPIAVDESYVTAGDVASVADRCDIVNVKLMKTGGVTPALDVIATAHAHELDVMVGCMLESNASIAAGVHLLPFVEYADLDGSLLLADDPYEGVPITGGHFDLTAVDRGTGATPR